ncbi:MAG: EF-hand domain-containing protein [Rhodospirillales bacterium]
MKPRTLLTGAIVGALGLGLLAAAPVDAKGPMSGGGTPGMMMFDRFDTDGDGKVTREEFRVGHEALLRQMEQRFDEADLDGDGAITRDEAWQAKQKMRAAWQAGGGPGGKAMRPGQGPRGGMGPGQGPGGGMGPGQGRWAQ